MIWTRISHHCASLATLNPLGCLLLVGSGDIHTPPGREWLCDGSALLRPLNWRTRTIKRTRFKLSVSPRGESRGGPSPIFRPNWRKIWDRPPPPYLRVWMTDPRPLIWRSGSATVAYSKSKSTSLKGLLYFSSPEKLARSFFVEGGEALSRAPNDKTYSIW